MERSPRPPVVDLSTLVEGYARAFERFKRATDPGSPREAFFPLFEALNWATSIDEYVDGWSGPPTLMGIRYVRNRVHHQWAEAVDVRDAPQRAAIGLGLSPGPYFEWPWRRPEDLPASRHKSGEGEYRSHLVGRDAGDSLQELNEHFKTLI